MSGAARRLLVGAVVGVGLVVLGVTVTGLVGDLRGLHAPYVMVAVLAAALGNGLVCPARWRVLQVPQLSLGAAVRRYAEALFVSVLVPGGVAGDIYRGAQHSSRSAGAAAVIADRAIGGLVTLAAAVPAVVVLTGASLGPAAIVAIALPLAAVGFVRRRQPIGSASTPGSLAETPVRSDENLELNGVRGRSARLAAALRAVGTSLRETLRRPAALASAAALSVGYLAFFAVFVFAVVRAVGVPLSARDAVVATPLVALAGMLPALHGVSPSHAVLAWVVTQAGGDVAATGSAVALALGITVLLAVAGGLSLLHRERVGVRSSVTAATGARAAAGMR